VAAYNKINDFVEQLVLGKHIFGTHVFKVALSNSAPVATNTILANITQIANANGYTTGGIDAQVTQSVTTGTVTVAGTMVVWTCVTAAMGPFQYVVLYNDTQTTPVDPLVCWWDYGSALTLQVGETFSVKFNGSATTGSIFTLA
jgi:hypothetical protein